MQLLSPRMRLALILFVWILALFAVGLWLSAGRKVHVAVGGGPADSESLGLMQAIASVLNESGDGFVLSVYETGGSSQNRQLLEAGHIDLGTIQADTPRSERIQGITTLYRSAYHLVARDNVGIESFAGLPARRIGIPPPSNGAHESFWFLADHYGLEPEQLRAQPMSEGAANFAMILGQVDAVFRVRAPGNPGISELVRSGHFSLVPIRQSEALSLKQPAITAGVIPLGSYRGSPPLPEQDLPTAVLEHLLVVRSDLDRDLVYRLTRAIYENRSRIIELDRLAGHIHPLPEDAVGVIPAHAGARSYFDREKPGLIARNARLVSALISAFAVIVSGLLALRSYWIRSRRLRMHGFNRQLVEIAAAVRAESDRDRLLDYKHRLIDMLAAVISDLEQQQVNQAEFEHFSFTWQAVDAMLRDRIYLLHGQVQEGGA